MEMLGRVAYEIYDTNILNKPFITVLLNSNCDNVQLLFPERTVHVEKLTHLPKPLHIDCNFHIYCIIYIYFPSQDISGIKLFQYIYYRILIFVLHFSIMYFQKIFYSTCITLVLAQI